MLKICTREKKSPARHLSSKNNVHNTQQLATFIEHIKKKKGTEQQIVEKNLREFFNIINNKFFVIIGISACKTNFTVYKI